MLFNSYPFLFVFLPVTLVAFYLVASHWAGIGVWVLAIASLGFYGYWDWHYLPLLVGSATFNWIMARLLERSPRGSTQRSVQLAVAITANLLLLGYFKYANFFLATFGTGWSLGTVILPLGISFFTFTQIAYLVDIYRAEPAGASYPKYLLFVTFFPHLIAGPILHHRETMPQFDRKLTPTAENFSVGLTIFAIGLFKKVVIADGVAPYATPVFDAAAQGHAVTFLEAWCGALAYTLQLYFDFSGYSDMAIGLARLCGVTFPLNFNSPYKATSIIEFWRRWHMTLSRFLRDYLYIPLGGSRRGSARRYTNLMATMLLGGLWHGAGWTFIIWGGLHGLYLVINHLWRAAGLRVGSPLLAGAITFLAVVVAWVFFRATSLDAALHMLAGMIGANGIVLPIEWQAKLQHLPGLSGLPYADLATTFHGREELQTLAALLALAWLAPNTQELMRRFAPALNAVGDAGGRLLWRPSLGWALAIAALTAIPLLQLNRVSEFLYYQF
jgi:D-alanyl-lipoteichoic acid acyltransferase DltB (MBOAT superfamily)